LLVCAVIQECTKKFVRFRIARASRVGPSDLCVRESSEYRLNREVIKFEELFSCSLPVADVRLVPQFPQPGRHFGVTVPLSEIDPPKRWLTFLRNHREAIAAMDFFTVPTLTFGILYCFFVIGHDRRKILRFNLTRSPNALWIVQQLREAWPYVPAHRFLLFDRDSKFGTDVISEVRDLGSHPTRTAFRCPWQNGVAERWVGSCRRDLLDHMIVLNEQHLKRMLSEYIRYYHEDRTHLGLAKDTPTGRPVEIRSGTEGTIHSFPRLGGLHHRYAVAA
jgi:hypothetical protein